MQNSRPCILIGAGVRASGAELAPRLLELGVPVLASWQAKDLLDNSHPMFMGCPGIYGNRAANKVLHAATEVLALGNRLAIWNVGYEGIRADQDLIIVSLDDQEAARYPKARFIRQDCGAFLAAKLEAPIPAREEISEWQSQCILWNTAYPWVEIPTHVDRDGFVNSYMFFAHVSANLADDAAIAIDCGSACASAFQTLMVKPPQRILSSGGLGEMGCALPAAIGASIARGRRESVCIVGDGAMMLNLQELQTIVSQRLPVKIIVCRNDGYLMIRKTQALAGMAHSGVDSKSGVSCPDFAALAGAFGIPAREVRNWKDAFENVHWLFAEKGPALLQYHMAPDQAIAPKLDPVYVGGKATSPAFDDMSPRL